MTFDATGSTDPDGTVAKYEWDLDGNGTYETDTGTTATATTPTTPPATSRSACASPTTPAPPTPRRARSRSRPRPGAAAPNQPPTASFTATPNPAQTGSAVIFDATGSGDPDGTIARYEWDLDGNGTYETDTGAVATASHTYDAAGDVTIGLRSPTTAAPPRRRPSR